MLIAICIASIGSFIVGNKLGFVDIELETFVLIIGILVPFSIFLPIQIGWEIERARLGLRHPEKLNFMEGLVFLFLAVAMLFSLLYVIFTGLIHLLPWWGVATLLASVVLGVLMAWAYIAPYNEAKKYERNNPDLKNRNNAQAVSSDNGKGDQANPINGPSDNSDSAPRKK